MKPEAQRIAIANACPIIVGELMGASLEWHWQDEFGTWHECFRNDPLRDLNATHEIECALTDKQYAVYANYLEQQFHYGRTIRSKSAAASQRVEALLKTLNLWTRS